MTIFEETSANWQQSLERASQILRGKVHVWDKAKLSLYWKTATETNLAEHLVFCILTPQTQTDILVGVFEDKAIAEREGFANWSEHEIAEELAKMKIRFPRVKASRIREFHRSGVNLRDLLGQLDFLSGDLRHERWSRLIVLDEVGSGFGLKVASLFLKDIGFAEHLAVLDSQNFRFAKKVGLLASDWKVGVLQDWRVYYKLEEWENALATRLGVTTAAIDWPIMDAGQSHPPEV